MDAQRRVPPRLTGLAAAALIGVAVGGTAPSAIEALLGAAPSPAAARGELTAEEEATIALFEAARRSVVYISTAERVFDPWTRDVHNIQSGTGSGFVWDEDGHVVTNAHVIEDADAAELRLADGSAWEARLVGVDPGNDLAVLRIDAETAPPPLARGTSAGLRVGQKVLAIGNPFGLDWTLTTGIVSALGRELPGRRGPAIRGLIQTDAAINPGNSGGPLLDSAGRLIGVNTAIYSPSGSSAGIGFAVPVDTLARVVPQLIAHGRYAPPTLGIRVDEQINALAARQGLEGVLVLGVERGSAAERAGLRPARRTPRGIVPGDVIVGLGAAPIANVEDLHAALAGHEAGEAVEVTVIRDGERMNLRAVLAPGL